MARNDSDEEVQLLGQAATAVNSRWTRVRDATICLMLVFQFCSFSLMRSHATSRMCDPLIMLLSETMKLCASIVANSFRLSSVTTKFHLACVPVACFATMNLLSLACLRHVDATLFSIVLQLKLPFTALFAFAIAGTRFSDLQIILMFGVCTGAAIMSMVDRRADGAAQKWWAIGGLVLETMLSGFAAAFMQNMFQMNKHDVWPRNIQISSLSIAVYGVIVLYTGCDASALDGWGIIFAAMSAFGGIVVALSITHLGAVNKVIITCGATGITTAVEMLTFTRFDSIRCLIVLNVLSLCVAYSRLPRHEATRGGT